MIDALGEVPPRGGQHTRLSAGNVGRPVGPAAAVEPALERDKQAVVVEPPAILVDELREPGLEFWRCPAGKRRGHFVQHSEPRADHIAECHVVSREGSDAVEPAGVDKAILAEEVERDQQRIARKCRERLVGRVTKAGRAERQHLPVSLRHLGEPLQPAVGLGADLTDAEAARKRRGMEENAGRAAGQRAGCGSGHGGFSGRGGAAESVAGWRPDHPWHACAGGLVATAAADRLVSQSACRGCRWGVFSRGRGGATSSLTRHFLTFLGTATARPVPRDRLDPLALFAAVVSLRPLHRPRVLQPESLGRPFGSLSGGRGWRCSS